MDDDDEEADNMAGGITTTDVLNDSLDNVRSSARIVAEVDGRMSRAVDRQTLGRNMGLAWREVAMAKLIAQSISETTVEENFQQLSDSLLTITPQVVSIATLITDRVAERINRAAFARTGGLAQNAIVRKTDEDGLSLFASAGTDLGGSGALSSGRCAAALVRAMAGNLTDRPPSNDPAFIIHHSYALKDIEDELRATIGTGEVTAGLTRMTFENGFRGRINTGVVMEDNNITVTSNSGVGGAFVRSAIVLVQGRTVRAEVERKQIGGGATAMWIRSEYAYGERAAGARLFGLTNDLAAPTS